MDFIFMLTRGDETVAHGLELLDSVADIGLRHIGFKDVGANRQTLRALCRRIRAMGAMSYLEVVEPGIDGCVSGADIATEIGIDRLLGGSAADTALEILGDTGIDYFPFAGFPIGHPTRLRGTEADIADHCAGFMEKGCAGADLLAYRATDADPLALVRAARAALGSGTLIVAGSVRSRQQLVDLARAGADAFTMGTAIFENAFAAAETGIVNQILAVQAILEDIGEPAPEAS